MPGVAKVAMARDPAHDPFSLARMRGSLYLFAAGKLLSGLIGVVWLLTLVRVLDVTAYGGYVVMLAMLEIILLVSNAGVYPFAQRYITEARLPHNLAALPKLVWSSLAYRVFTLLIAAGAVAWLAEPIGNLVRQPALHTALPLYAIVIVCEGASRYLELAFESLLEQGRAQLCAVIRNGMRLALLATAWLQGGTLSLVDVIQIEAISSAIGLALGCLVMAQGLRVSRRAVQGQVRQADSFSLRRLVPFALPLFSAQCLTQLYSPDTIKLLVSRLLGVADAATFGFAHAISFVIQRYLPANLLIGLIRPMLVARRANTGNDQDLVAVGNLILKINLFLLLPLATVFSVAGQEFASIASGGKFPNAGPLLFLMTLLLIFTGLHVVLSMLATALEDRRAVLLGTLISVPGVAVGIALVPSLGALAMVLGLWLSELLWCGFTLHLLRQSGFVFQLDLRAWVKLMLAAVIAGGAAGLIVYLFTITGTVKLAVVIAVVATAYLAVCIASRPLTLTEQTALLKLLPARFQKRRR